MSCSTTGNARLHHDTGADDFPGGNQDELPLVSGSEPASSGHTGWRSNWADPVETADAFVSAGQPGEAIALLQTLIETGRAGLLARLALVNAKVAANDPAGAVKAARDTVSLYPGAALAALALGKALLASNLLAAAIGEFQRAQRIDRGLTEPQFLLGVAWLEAGEAEKALEAFAELEPGAHPHLAARIAEAELLRAQPRANAHYVRHLFDQFSSDYDARMLGPLRYAGHAILRQLADLVLPVKENLAILDLGCGTGLSGAAFHDMAARLDGIDLSPAMIVKARERDLYNHLAVADIESALMDDGPAYDLLLAADTLVYLGDLVPVFAETARRLKPDGYFLFTVEKSEFETFELGPKRRWRHSETYLRVQAARAGFDIAGLIACTPRSEANQPVDGLAVALTLRTR